MFRNRLSTLIKTIILSGWLVMLALLVQRTYLQPTSVIALDIITEEGVRAGDEWFGIYQQNRKIGYAHTRIEPKDNAYHLYEESELDILVLGSLQRVRTVINSYTTKNFLLTYFDFAMWSEPTSMEIKGAVIKDKKGSVIKDMLVLDITSGGQTRKEQIALTEPPYLSPNIRPALVLLGLEPGKRYRFPLFSPVTMKNDDAYVTVLEKERIKVGDEEKTVFKLKESFQGMETVSWITQDGETIKEVSPLGYELLQESREEAKKRDKEGPAVDIIALTMIPSDRIKNQSEVEYLRARLMNASLKGYELDGGRQVSRGRSIEIRAQHPSSSYELPYSRKNLNEYLKSSVLVQSDDTSIRKQAKRILAGETDAVEAAKKLNAWTYSAIRKKPVVSIPSAVEVLKQRVGDCNEHTTLYAALARAVGIPTRIAVGIVYMENGFYYHAWPEVWLGAWIAVDPTFNQFPADATHIRFVTGSLDRQSEILRLVGRLHVDVIEYRHRPDEEGGSAMGEEKAQ